MESKIVTRKRVNILCQLLTIACVLAGVGAVVCLMLEVGELCLLNHSLYGNPAEQTPLIVAKEVQDMAEDCIEPAAVACGALGMAVVSSVVALVITCLSGREAMP